MIARIGYVVSGLAAAAITVTFGQIMPNLVLDIFVRSVVLVGGLFLAVSAFLPDSTREEVPSR